MGLKIIGLDAVAAMIKNDADKATQAARRRMRVEAQRIMELSQKNAPVDEGNLEAAHHIVTERDDRFRKTETVEVGGTVHGVDVDRYALVMHEAEYHLGPKSLAKQAGSGRMVGRKYLERAFKEREPFLNPAIKEEVDKSL